MPDGRVGQGGRWRAPTAALYGIAGVYLVAHLPFLASSLEDIDSINFALGLEDFDPSRHQPHPPGYPLYIALGRLSLATISSVWPDLSRMSAEALALSMWSALGGAIALVASARVFSALQEHESGHASSTLVATALLGSAPLFWISGLRPMSDMPGLAGALLAQALLLQGLNNPRRLVQGALVAGAAAGLRSQTLWLTIPLLSTALLAHRPAGVVWLLSRPIAALAGGAVVWAIPLIVASGGLHRYWDVLEAQARDDVTAVDMLWKDPTPHRLVIGLVETFAAPWGSVPLAVAVLGTAAVGGVILCVKRPRGIALLAVAFGPYAAFHVGFQDPFTVRYTLPLLPAVAWLASGVAVSRRSGWLVTASLVAGALAVAMPEAAAYSREPHPVFRAIDDAAQQRHATAPRVAFAHTEVWRGLQAAASGLRVIEPRRQHAWMGLVEYWRNGGTAPVWFFANPDRTDLALIDPYSRLDRVRYTWAVGANPEFGGTRPVGVDRYRFQMPGWLAGEGWSLTPETGGLAYANGKGLDRGPIEAYVLRRHGPMHAMVGGYLAESSDTNAQLELAIDRRVVDRWTLTPAARRLLRFVHVPEGILNGTGNYATLTIRSSTRDSNRTAPVFIRQFDIQPITRLLYGFGEGWHALELDPATGRTWRWTSEKSVLRIDGPVQDVRLTLRGESPLRYFDSPPTVTVTAGDRLIDRFHPDDDFEWQTIVPADAILRAGGAVAIEMDRVYLPAVAEGTADERRLGLRIYECRVEPLVPGGASSLDAR